MASFTLRFRTRAKDELSQNKKTIVLTATQLAENGAMTENQAHFTEGESPLNQITLFMDKVTELPVLPKGKDVLVTFTST